MRAIHAAVALVALMALSTPVAAHTYFTATLTGAGVPGTVSWGFYTHDGEIVWNANVTLPKGQSLSELAIVDGQGPGAVVAAAVPVSPPLEGPVTAQAINGSFVAAGTLNPAVAADEKELAGHICMGHIYGRATTAKGELEGAFAYDPRGKNETCEEAVGAHGGAAVPAAKDDPHAGHDAAATAAATTAAAAAPSPAPPPSGATAAGLAGAAVAAALAVLL